MDGLVLFHSYQSSLRSTGRGSRIPSRRGFQGSWSAKLAYFSHCFAIVSHFLKLLKSSWFWGSIFLDFVIDFGWFGEGLGWFWEGFGMFFR